MAVIGISLILASVIYVAIRRPPLIETLLALWRGDPKIEQPPPSSSSRGLPRQAEDDGPVGEHVPDASVTSSMPAIVVGADTGDTSGRAAMPPPPPPAATTRKENGSASRAAEWSPQTTPKASATQINDSGVPTFTLSPEPPASAAAVARSQSVSSSSSRPSVSSTTTTATTTNASPPSLSGAPPSAPLSAAGMGSASSSTLMAPPPPRAPTLAPLPSSGSASRPAARTSQAQLARQPGTSTLAPPPTHSAKPTKPSRKVTLEPGCSPLDWARLAQSPTSDLRGLPPGTPYLRVPPSLLKSQNGRRGRDAWTAMGGRVYNITPYLRFHPGGEAELLRGAGRDGTRLFGEVHPWVNYEAMLASCLVGVLVAEGEEGGAGVTEMEEMD
ncbi:hypothetical protein DL764_006048 [Monosporascus ibericus]|uniref:Cytochrome b5 heme-binding domain-containing protein n=1 Tax=Monosporascus ibericus TaxID=155417 RepID=A0A4Q4T621_9PEZI|nr:hypothetical protein DL764_006048 [Monosporascus ibericus]